MSPTASDEQRARWDGPSDKRAITHLRQRGYVLTSGFDWYHPEPDWSPSETDLDAMHFLQDEWDFGGYLPQPKIGEYRKMPVVVRAVQVTRENLHAVEAWVRTNHAKAEIAAEWDTLGLRIKTLEGTVFADVGDYVIQGVKGEFYPCDPDVFHATYERADRVEVV